MIADGLLLLLVVRVRHIIELLPTEAMNGHAGVSDVLGVSSRIAVVDV